VQNFHLRPVSGGGGRPPPLESATAWLCRSSIQQNYDLAV